MLAVVFTALFPLRGSADMVIMKDEKRIKGVVVEDYRDRIVFSTIDGEIWIMRKKIERIIYDLEEQNFTSLAYYYQDREQYRKAYYYYEKALAVNPDYKEAKQGLSYTEIYIQQTGRRLKLDELKRRNEETEWNKMGGIVYLEKKTSEGPIEAQAERELGLTLKAVNGVYVVSKVTFNSPAKRAKIKKKDILVAAWGRLLAYMEPEDVFKKLLTSGIMDIHVTIERPYFLNLSRGKDSYDAIIGGKLAFTEMEGLKFIEVYEDGSARKKGIKKDDIVVKLQDRSTRYMSFKEVEQIITSRKGDSLSLKIKRNVVIWREKE